MVLTKKRVWDCENLFMKTLLYLYVPSWINDIEVTLSSLFSCQFPGYLGLQVHLGREELQRILLIVLGNLFSYYWETYFLTLSCVKISLSSFSPSKSLVRVPSSSSFCLSTLPISVSHFLHEKLVMENISKRAASPSNTIFLKRNPWWDSKSTLCSLLEICSKARTRAFSLFKRIVW